MDAEPNRNVGRSKLSGESSSVSAPRETDPTPAVTRPGAGLTSTMVTRSRAREGRSTSVDPEVESRPETGARRGEEEPVPTSALCEMGLPAARPSSTRVLTSGMTEVKPRTTVATVGELTPVFRMTWEFHLVSPRFMPIPTLLTLVPPIRGA